MLLAAGYTGAFVFAVAATGALWGMAAAGWARKRRAKVVEARDPRETRDNRDDGTE